MKKAKKVLALLLCAVLLVGASVAGTLAYLTSQDTATNTFTVGKVKITLQEYEVDDQTGKKTETEAKVDNLEEVELVPGRVIEKNPFITVASDSETCWLFVKIENKLGDAVTIDGLAENGWTAVEGHAGYYQYAYSVSANTVVPVFNSVTCVTTKTYEQLNGITDKEIMITAYAVQSEGVSQQNAWGALGQHHTLN